jgi:2,4-dienoyl-CoA reductase-like NADH-dependent reductase (Old Yellow Enzyme family)
MFTMSSLFDPLPLAAGPVLKNRFVLAPLTNLQSHPDGVLSDDEFRWLTKRAIGGFGLTMTCAASVDAGGLGFPGQLGVHDDKHLPGLSRLAETIRKEQSHAVVQIHHAGMRSPKDLVGTPVAPSENAEFGARALSGDEVERLRDQYIAAAVRSAKAGFDGVELHGAHGYLICQFLSPETNTRDDKWGGPLDHRTRFLDEIIAGVRAQTAKDFTLGVRLSPERFGLKLGEIREVAQKLMTGGQVDYLDMSLWDVFKTPEEEQFKSKTLVEWFTDLPRGRCALGAAGKITTGDGCAKAMAAGLDYVLIGRGAILHHDFPKKVAADPHFTPVALPVPEAHLRNEGLGDAFVGYMKTWKGFVAEGA